MNMQEIHLESRTLRVFTSNGVIYAEIDGGTKQVISTHAEELTLDRRDCAYGQARIVWSNGVETFLDICGDAITVL